MHSANITVRKPKNRPHRGESNILAFLLHTQKDITEGRTTNPGSAWLLADARHGRLIARLMDSPFDPLVSEAVIADGQWHHVGLIYDFDGLHRHLYVDGAEVAKDSDVVGGVGADGSLYFGVGPALQTGTFWSVLNGHEQRINGRHFIHNRDASGYPANPFSSPNPPFRQRYSRLWKFSIDDDCLRLIHYRSATLDKAIHCLWIEDWGAEVRKWQLREDHEFCGQSL